MKLAKINMNSPAEVKGEFSDVVFFQGCTRNCVYCFNPELKEMGTYEQNKPFKEIAQALYNSFSGVVVLSGGEPLDQPRDEILNLIKLLIYTGKKVVLETSKFDSKIFKEVTHVLYTIKSWDIDKSALISISDMKNVTPVVITDHKDFNWNGYMDALECLDIIYHRPYDGLLISRKWTQLYKLAKKYKTQLKRFTQVCL